MKRCSDLFTFFCLPVARYFCDSTVTRRSACPTKCIVNCSNNEKRVRKLVFAALKPFISWSVLFDTLSVAVMQTSTLRALIANTFYSQKKRFCSCGPNCL